VTEPGTHLPVFACGWAVRAILVVAPADEATVYGADGACVRVADADVGVATGNDERVRPRKEHDGAVE
jgi:hypothetical protein